MILRRFVTGLLVGCLLLASPLATLAAEGTDIMEVTWAYGYSVPEFYRPKSSIVINADTGEVVWEDNADLVRDPASMTKMMVIYLLYEDIAKGKLSLETTIQATQTDEAISRILEISNNDLYAGVAYPVNDLISMTVVASSNAATVMLANYLSNGDASAFVDRMNTAAKQLGMTKTRFFNASGAVAASFRGYYNPAGYDLYAFNETTARDLTKLAKALVTKYPDILTHTNLLDVVVMAGTPYEQYFHSTNHSLPGNAYGLLGVDGLKTGSSPSAAFNNIVTAERGDIRLISVIMGVGSWEDLDNSDYYRNAITNALLEKSFAIEIAKKEEELAKEKAKRVTQKSKNKPKKRSLSRPAYPLSKRLDLYLKDYAGQTLLVLIVLAIALAYKIGKELYKRYQLKG